ncbi:MAG: sigma-70 family RNA polymerase sigma factor [Erysipelotrichaceae bacterium]|nr:sigma-70 family RNA polymerase sigma factor [Erysipelotrichaceae bacterium]MDY5251502.1 sigma-70 family RNA polymerase sigma factor [Erysipelotrichaceae bacterium]
MRSEAALKQAIDKYGDMVKRICMVHLKNHADMEDIFQNVFLRYYQDDTDFVSEEHEKAWMIKVTINACKDLLKSFFHRQMVPLDDYINSYGTTNDEHKHVLSCLLQLPPKYKLTLYLYYYEGYKVEEIAKILKKKPASIYSLLQRGRMMMKDVLSDEEV